MGCAPIVALYAITNVSEERIASIFRIEFQDIMSQSASSPP
jgi:hypothetical protein